MIPGDEVAASLEGATWLMHAVNQETGSEQMAVEAYAVLSYAMCSLARFDTRIHASDAELAEMAGIDPFSLNRLKGLMLGWGVLVRRAGSLHLNPWMAHSFGHFSDPAHASLLEEWTKPTLPRPREISHTVQRERAPHKPGASSRGGLKETR